MSIAHAQLLALGLAGRLAHGALVAVALDVVANQALGAAPPGRRGVAAVEPLLVDGRGAASLLNVLLVELAQVVAEVVAAVERVAAARALGVVAKVRLLLRGGGVLVLVVSVEVGASLEGFGVAAGEQADDGIVASLGAEGIRVSRLLQYDS